MHTCYGSYWDTGQFVRLHDVLFCTYFGVTPIGAHPHTHTHTHLALLPPSTARITPTWRTGNAAETAAGNSASRRTEPAAADAAAAGHQRPAQHSRRGPAAAARLLDQQMLCSLRACCDGFEEFTVNASASYFFSFRVRP